MLRSAYELMSQRGVHRVTLEDVADRAGVSKGLVLYHFKTKVGLTLATMRWALSALPTLHLGRTSLEVSGRLIRGLQNRRGAGKPRARPPSMCSACIRVYMFRVHLAGEDGQTYSNGGGKPRHLTALGGT